ncbi:MAG: hypothetical protein J1G06_09020 [Oscillospiraceae bacterium]|nr:hypothetical protein [Oscillospiraceae bacterium]
MNSLRNYRPPMPDNMTWYKAYRFILILFIIAALNPLIVIQETITNGGMPSMPVWIAGAISIIEVIAMVYLIVNIPKLTKSVYYVSQGLMLFEGGFYIILIAVGAIIYLASGESYILSLGIQGTFKIILCALNYIYFRKRKHYFIY